MAEKTATFELGTNGANIATGDAGSLTAWDLVHKPIGNIIYDNAHAYGNLAAKITTTTASECGLKWNMSSVTDHYGRLYLYRTGNPANSSALCNWGAAVAQLYLANDGKISLRNNANTQVGITTNAIGLNQFVRIEWHLVHSATVGQFEVKLFNSPDSGTPTETVSLTNQNLSTSTAGNFMGTSTGSVASQLMWLDNIVEEATSYPGPAAAAATAYSPGFRYGFR